MHVVTGGALARRDRGMLNLLVEFLFVMTPEAELYPCGKEELLRLGLAVVRLGMTGHTTARLYYRMVILPRHLVLVAGHADRGISRMGSAGSPDDEGKHGEDEKKTIAAGRQRWCLVEFLGHKNTLHYQICCLMSTQNAYHRRPADRGFPVLPQRKNNTRERKVSIRIEYPYNNGKPFGGPEHERRRHLWQPDHC